MSENTSSSFSYLTETCNMLRVVESLYLSFMIIKCLLVVPVSILILHLACWRWRRHRSFQTGSHVEVFTYNAAALELIFGLAVIFYQSGYYTGASGVMALGIYALNVAFPGEIILHIMTCLERYLAVIHPVIYLGLRQSGGTRIRNICIMCVWLLSLGWAGILAHIYPYIPFILYFVFLATSLLIISFCNLSVLCALFHKKQVGGANTAKKKAFVTITAILGVIVVYVLAAIFALALKRLDLLSNYGGCMLMACVQGFGLPISLVLPLLFLQRAKELQSCCSNKYK